MTVRARRRIHVRSAPQRSVSCTDRRRIAHRGDPRHVAGVHEQDGRIAVDRRASPLAAAVEAREDDGPFAARRREQPVVAQAGKARSRCRVCSWRQRGDVRIAHRLAGKRKGERGEGLRGPRHLAGEIGARHRALLHGKERLTARAVEEEDEARLGDLRDGIDALPGARDGHEVRRGRKVAVPDVVMHGLEVPDPTPGGRVEREERVGVQVRPDALRRRRSPASPSRWGRRPARGRHRRSSPATSWPRRPAPIRRRATSRSLLPRVGESCGTSSGCARCARRRRARSPAPPLRLRRRASPGSGDRGRSRRDSWR